MSRAKAAQKAMKSQIKIGDVSLPLNEFAVSGTAILGIKKAGKTWCAKGVAEQLLEHGIPIIVFDAIGVWRFLKTPGDSPHAKGFKIVVAGGEEPDLPLTAANACEIIRASMRSNVSLVIDLYDAKLSKGDWRKIVQTSFRTLLYENKKFGPRYVFLEEAAEYVPQKIYDGETFAEVEKFVRMGGNAQLGIGLINQRSQEVNKSVLDLCDNLVLMRQRGNSAIDAVQKWMDKVSPDIADELTKSLPNMKQGDAWVWAEDSDTPVRTHTGPIKSFHPDRTLSQQDIAKRKSVDTDEFVSKLRSDLGKVIEEAKTNNPAELQKEIRNKNAHIRELEHNLSVKSKQVIRAVVEKIKEVPALTDVERKRLTKLIDSHEALESMAGKLIQSAQNVSTEAELNRLEIRFFKELLSGKLLPAKSRFENLEVATRTLLRPHNSPEIPRLPPRLRSIAETNGDVSLGKCERTLLSVLAQFPEGCNRKKLILLAGYCWSGSTQNALGKLRSLGLIEGSNNAAIRITHAGLVEGPFEELPQGEELIRYWRCFPHFGKCERELFRVLSENPDGLDRNKLLELSGYEWSGSTQNALGALRTAGVITGRNNEVMRLSDELLNVI